jgi:hypothetical protein
MTILDRACWERGCPCYDPKEGEGVEVIRKEWVGLTDEEIEESIKSCNTTDTYKYFRAIESKLKEKNT